MKEKETIEEIAERFYSEQSKAFEDAIEPIFDNSRYLVAGFIEGAKWQQEQSLEMEKEQIVEETYKRIGLMEIELNHTKRLLASCEKALEDRDNKYLTFKQQEQ